MPHFWDNFGKTSNKHRNLQDGLFQIATQTCSLLVQVNNTNNISYGNHATNIHCNSLDQHTKPSSSTTVQEQHEQLLVLLPPSTGRTPKYKPGALGKPRLSVNNYFIN